MYCSIVNGGVYCKTIAAQSHRYLCACIGVCSRRTISCLCIAVA